MVDSWSNGIFITYGTSPPNGPLKHNIMGGYSLPVNQIKTGSNLVLKKPLHHIQHCQNVRNLTRIKKFSFFISINIDS